MDTHLLSVFTDRLVRTIHIVLHQFHLVALTNTMTKKQLKEGKGWFGLVDTSRPQFITEGNQGRNSKAETVGEILLAGSSQTRIFLS